MPEKVLLVFRFDTTVNDSHVEEMVGLAQAAGYDVTGTVVQTRAEDSKYNIGAGKVEELGKIIKEKGATKVIFYNMLKPSQVYNLRKELKVDVIDRYELILEIFAKRAGSREAKLQIELAKLKRELSFAREYINLSKRGELHGFLGGGKYAVDAYYTYVARRISLIERSLEKIRQQKNMRFSRRGEAGLYSVSLTGYTSAGKSTLFQKFTQEEVYIDGKPFATLSTLTRRTKLLGHPVLITDTIGFIDSLPDQLVDAFYTTLQETVFSDVIVLVVDISEDAKEVIRKFNTSIDILSSLGVSFNRIIIAANKIDLLDASQIEKRVEVLGASGFPVIPISAKKGVGLFELSQAIISKLPDKKIEKLVLKPGSSNLLSEALRKCRVIDISEDADGSLKVIVEGRAETIARLKARCR
ncbi:MAG: GTPase HflX [Infirmifilum sp.]